MRVSTYRCADPIDRLLPLFVRAGGEDKMAERRTRTFGCLGALAVPEIILFAVLGGNLHWFFFLFVPFGLLQLIGFVVGALLSQRHNLDDRKLATLVRVLSMLRADIPSTERVFVQVDFRDYRKGGQLLAREGGRFGARQLAYEHHWLDVRTRLADGSAVSFALTDRIRRKEKPKRKYTKVAERTVSAVSVALRLARRYGDASAVVARLQQLAPPGALTVRQTTAHGRAVKAVVTTPPTLTRTRVASTGDCRATGDTLLDTLRWVYRGIAATRTAA